MKCAILVVSAVVALASASPLQKSLNELKQNVAKDINDCNPLQSDTVLYSNVLEFKNASPGEVIEQEVYLPESGVFRSPITCIIVRDLNQLDEQGEAIVLSGGIGNYFVELTLLSARGKDILVRVELRSL